jgi:hypothetical protein
MNKACLALSAVFPLCAALNAQPAPKQAARAPAVASQVANVTREVDPVSRSNMLARTGGVIQSVSGGPSIKILNTQKRVSMSAFLGISDQIQRLMRLSCKASDTPSKEPVAAALKALSDTNTAAVIVIGDSHGYPALLVAPESRWALVNIAALGGDGVTPEKLNERAQKEVWRAFGYVMGASNSNFEHCLLKPVFSSADLDALPGKHLGPEPLNKISQQAQKLGMSPLRVSTYRKAVEEGWAPAPTNDFQRAIWQELKK